MVELLGFDMVVINCFFCVKIVDIIVCIVFFLLGRGLIVEINFDKLFIVFLKYVLFEDFKVFRIIFNNDVLFK